MEFYSCVKIIHTISAAILFGTSILLFTYCTWSYVQNCSVILSDAFHTTLKINMAIVAPCGLLQLLTGFTLVYFKTGHYSSDWIASVLSAYSIATLCWLSGLHLLDRCHQLILTSENSNLFDSSCFRTSFIIWVVLCLLGIGCMLGVFDLMM